MYLLEPKEDNMKKGKRYQESAKLVENGKVYEPKDALEII